MSEQAAEYGKHTGRLEVVVKFHEKPPVLQVEGGHQFTLDCGGTRVVAAVSAKAWRKCLSAMETYPEWVGAVSGKVAVVHEGVIQLRDCGLQVFEKKPKVGAS